MTLQEILKKVALSQMTVGVAEIKIIKLFTEAKTVTIHRGTSAKALNKILKNIDKIGGTK